MSESAKECGTCICFLLLNKESGKGRCRFMPPNAVPEREVSKNDVEGKRWPTCWSSEWCYQWQHK